MAERSSKAAKQSEYRQRKRAHDHQAKEEFDALKKLHEELIMRYNDLKPSQAASQVEELAFQQELIAKLHKQIDDRDRQIAARDAKITSLEGRLAARAASAKILINRYRQRADRARIALDSARQALAAESAAKKRIESESGCLAKKLKILNEQMTRIRKRHVNKRPRFTAAERATIALAPASKAANETGASRRTIDRLSTLVEDVQFTAAGAALPHVRFGPMPMIPEEVESIAIGHFQEASRNGVPIGLGTFRKLLQAALDDFDANSGRRRIVTLSMACRIRSKHKLVFHRGTGATPEMTDAEKVTSDKA